MPDPKSLFQYHDGSVLKLMKASQIATLDVWKGNRIIDIDHRNAIQTAIGNDVKRLDLKPFHIVRYMKERDDGIVEYVKELVDGQHRASILQEFFESKGDTWEQHDFDVLAIIKCCTDEQSIITYFRMLNHTKAIEWQEDPNLAVNRYLHALLNRFNRPYKSLIRQGKTRAPYVGIDAIREEMLRRRIHTKIQLSPEDYADAIWNAHQKGLAELREANPSQPNQVAALKAGCILALFKRMDWLEP
jgi:hypothetical protein